MIVPYCERLMTGAEPVNIASNIGFALAGLAGFYYLFRARARASARSGPQSQSTAPHRPILWLLVSLPVGIAVGSALFHWRPDRLTQALDIVPIGCFVALTAGLIMRRQLSWPAWKITFGLLLWLLCSLYASRWPGVFAGSLFYLPTAIMLAALSWRAEPIRRQLAWVFAVFVAALIARASDLPLCGEVLPMGTHALWHLLAATSCLLGIRLVIHVQTESLGCYTKPSC
jgi:hypothetical protein